MTGWRLGWMLMPEAMLPSVDKLAQNIFLAAPTVAQHAALVALTAETRGLLEGCKAELKMRRDALLPELTRLGFEVKTVPQGAFYCYADVSRFGMSAEALAERLLLDAGVAITPGNDFGSHAASRNVRFAYTTSRDRILEAMRRIEAVLA
jgi:aspartate/methionine/tyrosine aminotransferase